MTSSWWKRLDDRRRARDLSVTDLCKVELLGKVSRQTYYNWRKDPSLRPRSSEVVEALAAFLGEDPAAFRQEIGQAEPALLAPMGFAVSREMGLQLFRTHVAALHAALGSTSASVDHPGLDVVLRLLREGLPAAPDPIPALVGSMRVDRGREHRVPYQEQIYVVPLPQGDDQSASALRSKVDAILEGCLLPVTREHSRELVHPRFRDADVLIYPRLLDLMAPGWGVPPNPPADLLVLGVFYSGAPDVGALLAQGVRAGFSTLDHLTRLAVPTGLHGLPSERFDDVIAQISVSIAQGLNPGGPTVWASDNPRAVVDEIVSFPGTVVLIELGPGALAYAAARLVSVDPVDSREWRGTVARRRQDLEDRQRFTRKVVDRCPRRLVRRLELPAEITADGRGRFPDAVDVMFDEYVGIARSLALELQA